MTGETGAKGATGSTGPTGAGTTGPTGPTGSGGGAEKELASGKEETGAWSAELNGETNDLEMEAHATISFKPKLQEYPAGEGVKVKYKNATESEKPEAPCFGSPDEPIAEKAWLCVLRGGAGNGSKENEDLNVTKTQGANKTLNVFFESPFGETITEIENVKGQTGVDVVFRSSPYVEAAATTSKLTTPAKMVAHGSWAVTAR